MNEQFLNELKVRFAKELATESSNAYSMGMSNMPRPIDEAEAMEIVDRIVDEIRASHPETISCPSCGAPIPLVGAHSCPGCGYSI